MSADSRPVAFVTGSATGVGRACAIEFAKRDFNVVVNYSKSEAEATQTVKDVESLDARALLVCADVAIKEIGKAADEKAKEISDNSGLTAELVKKHAAAQKSLKDSGLKRKELVAAVNEKAGLSEDQATAIKDVNAIRMKMQKDVIALLTDEQKGALPEQMKREPKKSGEPKKKKKKDQ